MCGLSFALRERFLPSWLCCTEEDTCFSSARPRNHSSKSRGVRVCARLGFRSGAATALSLGRLSERGRRCSGCPNAESYLDTVSERLPGRCACRDVVICVLLCSQRQLPAVGVLVQMVDENAN